MVKFFGRPLYRYILPVDRRFCYFHIHNFVGHPEFADSVLIPGNVINIGLIGNQKKFV